MENISYIKGDLLTLPKGYPLVHACNAENIWGSGIAEAIKDKYPESYKECRNAKLKAGDCFKTSDNIVCLVTSTGYGAFVDPPVTVLKSTWMALESLLREYPEITTFYSNKFNSGLFNVPWKDTEAILKLVLKGTNIKWVVYHF